MKSSAVLRQLTSERALTFAPSATRIANSDQATSEQLVCAAIKCRQYLRVAGVCLLSCR
jgi:hypothetical protein